MNQVTVEMLVEQGRGDDIERLITLADLGITGVSVRSEEIDPEVVSAVRSLISTLTAKSEDAPEDFDPDPNQTLIEFEHSGGAGATARIGLNDESRGTRMWFSHIGPVLKVLSDGGLLVVDELDASLHPRLSSEILRLFADPETNPRSAQLLFSTHDTSLLGNLLDHRLSREDVWFTEKDNTGATLLYPLSDFRPRKDEALERGYLQGRYGAVPIVDFAELAEQLK
jgi:AAA15 family ATPase/GTPase